MKDKDNKQSKSCKNAQLKNYIINQINPIEKEVTNLPSYRCITKVSPMGKQKLDYDNDNCFFEKLENQKTNNKIYMHDTKTNTQQIISPTLPICPY
jgi:hypothetical protein